MAYIHRYTEAQRQVMRQIDSGMIINKSGSGYSLRSANGEYIGKASIAVKSLGREWLVAKAGNKIYFTTRGYWSWHGGEPTGEALELCKLADARVEWVKSMMVEK